MGLTFPWASAGAEGAVPGWGGGAGQGCWAVLGWAALGGTAQGTGPRVAPVGIENCIRLKL